MPRDQDELLPRSQEELRELKIVGSDAWLRNFYEGWYPFAPESGLSGWIEDVRSLVVKLHPGGRATVTHPPNLSEFEGETRDISPRWTVEVRWRMKRMRLTRDDLTNADGLPEDFLQALPITYIEGPFTTSIQIKAGEDQHLPHAKIDMGGYVAAVQLAIAEPHERSEHESLPAPGKPASTGFYENLVADYKQLIGDGHPAPVQELARQRKQKVGTVKSWLWRAEHKYLNQGGSDGNK